MADEVATELRRMVLAGEFEAGQRLTQDQLAKTLGVSTMPVREALLRLAAEGLIIASANRSFSVASNTVDDLRDIFWMHSTLQGELSRRACLHADDDLVKTLTEHHKRYLAVIDDKDARFDANWSFFRIVNLASHAPRLLLMIRFTLRFFPDILHNSPGTPELAGKWHRDLLRAIAKHEPDKAKAVSEKYARQAGELHIAALRGSDT
jgi:DNA-binding GntR family transcriptional regulator